ncbi:MAG: hypothetical protein SW833_23430 [Cyanobacteriota bacterium]|nr:hypothetical protein [Cyanobacteriota bacterium]
MRNHDKQPRVRSLRNCPTERVTVQNTAVRACQRTAKLLPTPIAFGLDSFPTFLYIDLWARDRSSPAVG